MTPRRALALLLFSTVVAVLLYSCLRAERDPEPALEPATVVTDPTTSATELVPLTEAGSDAVVDESLDPTGTEGAGAEGPLGGTWNMWWNERVALTIRFVGVDRGTIEILDDETEFDTFFELDGDDVEFRFTRLVGDREVPEQSRWQGSFVSAEEVDGEWYRQEWTCPPPPSECLIGTGFDSHESTLVRDSSQ